MKKERINGKVKLFFSFLLAVVLCVNLIPNTALAANGSVTVTDANTKLTGAKEDGASDYAGLKLTDAQFYEDGSLKSVEISFSAAFSFERIIPYKNAVSIHTEKFGSVVSENKVPPTNDMKYYLYNGSDTGTMQERYVYKDANTFNDEPDKLQPNLDLRDGYWENYLYKDYSCTEIGTMTTSRMIYDVTWNPVEADKQFPQDCYFKSWGLDENGKVKTISAATDDSFTNETLFFTEGQIKPGDEYHVYLWGEWINRYDMADGWWNPNGIYPESYYFSFKMPDVTYTVTYTDGVENAEIFADRQHTDIPSGSATPNFDGAQPQRKGYVFKGWSPAVADTVTQDVTYTAQWELASEEKPNGKDFNVPNTNDSTNVALLFICAGVSLIMIIVTLVHKRKAN